MATRLDTARQGMALPHGRSSMPSVVDSITPRHQSYSNSNNNNTRPLLPRLSTGSLRSDSEEKRPKLLIETVIVPSRAVAQSMMTVSNSCPDLTNSNRNGSPPVSSSNSDVATPSNHSRLVRCRVPLSMASTPRLPRKASGHPQTARESQAKPSTSKAPIPQAESPQHSEGTPTLRRRPVTHEGRMSCSSGTSPGNTPTVSRRRRAGQYSLTAANDVLAQANVVNAWTASPAEQPSGRTSGLSRLRDSLPANLKDSISNIPQTPPLTSRQNGGQQLTRQGGNPKKPLVKRNSSLSLPSNRSATGNNKDIVVAAKVEGSQVKSTPSEVLPESSIGEVQEEQSTTEAMAPETYQRCMQWVIDVESAKGDRPLEAIMLPPVQLIE